MDDQEDQQIDCSVAGGIGLLLLDFDAKGSSDSPAVPYPEIPGLVYRHRPHPLLAQTHFSPLAPKHLLFTRLQRLLRKRRPKQPGHAEPDTRATFDAVRQIAIWEDLQAR